MPLHPQVQAHLDRLAGSNFADLHDFAPEQVRQGMKLMKQALGPGEAVASVRDRVIATEAGDLPIRIYHPQPDEQRPALVFFYGGGFVLGDLTSTPTMAWPGRSRTVPAGSSYPSTIRWPPSTNIRLRSVPAIPQRRGWPKMPRTSAATKRTSRSPVTAPAAVVALMARDAGGPAIARQVLIYPDLDFRRCNVSIQEFAGKYGNITRPTQQWFMNHYLNGVDEKLEAHVSPPLAPRLEGLHPALIVTAEFDVCATRARSTAPDFRRREFAAPSIAMTA